MNEPTSYLRVLYCVLLIAATIEPMPHQELARCDGGIVVATDDESALKLLESAPAAQLLYFSLEDYRRAVRDLDAEQIEAAVHKRRERFSADPLAHGSRRLLELERRVLTCAAASAGDQEPLRRMEAALAGMRTISTDPIWDDAELTAVLMALLDAESKVVAELQGPAAPLAVDGESRMRRDFASPVMSYLTAQGQNGYDRGLPSAGVIRALSIDPADEDLLSYLELSREPFVRWQGAVVTPWPLWKVDNLEARNKTLTTMYASTNEFLYDAYNLSEAQLHRELAMRAGADEEFRTTDLARHVNKLRVESALVRGTAAQKAEESAPALGRKLDGQSRPEVRTLSAALSRHPSWASAQTLEDSEAHARAKERVIEEARFLAGLAETMGRPDLSEQWTEYGAAREKEAE